VNSGRTVGVGVVWGGGGDKKENKLVLDIIMLVSI